MAARTRVYRDGLLAAAGWLLVACAGGKEPHDPSTVGPTPPVLEYLQVTFVPGPGASDPAAVRRVLVNGKPLGTTAELIEFEGGRCVVSLEGPDDYEPAERTVVVDGTSALTPHELVFRGR